MNLKQLFQRLSLFAFLPTILTGIIVAVLLTPSVSAAAVESPNSRIDIRIHSYEYGYFKEDGIFEA